MVLQLQFPYSFVKNLFDIVLISYKSLYFLPHVFNIISLPSILSLLNTINNISFNRPFELGFGGGVEVSSSLIVICLGGGDEKESAKEFKFCLESIVYGLNDDVVEECT
eukprot:342210_1